jgi:hypothetical protein
MGSRLVRKTQLEGPKTRRAPVNEVICEIGCIGKPARGGIWTPRDRLELMDLPSGLDVIGELFFLGRLYHLHGASFRIPAGMDRYGQGR